MTLTGGMGLNALVERRIQTAIARGEFTNLPGAGRPLPLDNDLLVPAELRVAHRILKNAGFVPPELSQVAEVNQLLGALARDGLSETERGAQARRLRALLIQLEMSGRTATAASAWQQYQDQLCRRYAGDPPQPSRASD